MTESTKPELDFTKITYAELLFQNEEKKNPFLEALRNISAIKLPVLNTVQLKKLWLKIEEETKIAAESRMEIYKSKGMPVDGKSDEYTLMGISKEAMAEAVQALNDLAVITFDTGFTGKIVLPHSADISVNDLILLDRFLKIPE